MPQAHHVAQTMLFPGALSPGIFEALGPRMAEEDDDGWDDKGSEGDDEDEEPEHEDDE